ncbi:hypothetical protein Scep_005537 [Stephania cephalantha]|uniref:YGGT family protein n=1 Tax=Stephania cephalantha TaxID=152367 RepID=A0AAP0PWG5_9MAGN
MSTMAMASQKLLLQNPNFVSSCSQKPSLCTNRVVSVRDFGSKPYYNPLKLRFTARVSASSLQTFNPSKNANFSIPSIPSESFRSIGSLFAMAVSIARALGDSIRSISLKLKGIASQPTPEELAMMQKLKGNLVCAIGPLFFAAMRDRPSGYLNTPLTVVAAGMAKWLDIYSGVLMVRVLLSWFPNIPWDRQPLSAIRDLCDPYLNLFRNIIPPVFDTLDVSPLLAFAVLGTLGSILNSSKGTY